MIFLKSESFVTLYLSLLASISAQMTGSVSRRKRAKMRSFSVTTIVIWPSLFDATKLISVFPQLMKGMAMVLRHRMSVCRLSSQVRIQVFIDVRFTPTSVVIESNIMKPKGAQIIDLTTSILKDYMLF